MNTAIKGLRAIPFWLKISIILAAVVAIGQAVIGAKVFLILTAFFAASIANATAIGGGFFIYAVIYFCL